MNDYCLVVNLDRCINCQACEIACQVGHRLSPETYRIRIVKNEAREEQGRVTQDYIPTLCLQCQARPCIDACVKKRAIRDVDGVVVIDRELCDGCRLCVFGCPYGMIVIDQVSGKAEKCDLCYDRAAGLPPACVANCWGGALMWVPRAELSADLASRQDGSSRLVTYISQRREMPVLDY